MKTERRWLKAAITAATKGAQVPLPFQRGLKKRPAALTLRPVAIAVAAR